MVCSHIVYACARARTITRLLASDDNDACLFRASRRNVISLRARDHGYFGVIPPLEDWKRTFFDSFCARLETWRILIFSKKSKHPEKSAIIKQINLSEIHQPVSKPAWHRTEIKIHYTRRRSFLRPVMNQSLVLALIYILGRKKRV